MRRGCTKCGEWKNFPYNDWTVTMPSLRRKQIIYVTLDPFLSPRGKVLHQFEQFLSALYEADFPCVWLTSLTRAQLDEPRRRLGHSAPFIGEGGCGVYLPEDYFHLKSRETVRLGRFTCIPIAKPQPAAEEALEELSADTAVPVVSLRSLSLRELSQNTGLPAGQAERIRMRDFDELFFFAGAGEEDTARFQAEAKLRGLTLQNLGAFWSLSIGSDPGKCIRELGGLYDRALRAHALRVAVTVVASEDDATLGANPVLKTLGAACDRTIVLCERPPLEQGEVVNPASEDHIDREAQGVTPVARRRVPGSRSFHLHSEYVWDELIEWIRGKS
jgi:predicted mannosyl-3-phosphoglycerate phosphatase (HAD superfamily)